MKIIRCPKLSKSMKRFFRLIFFTVLILNLSNVQAQQSSRITGVVVDKGTDEPLPGANVFLEGTSIGAATGIDGKFYITNVPPGDFILVVK